MVAEDVPADFPVDMPADIPADTSVRTEDLELSVHVTDSVSLEGSVIRNTSSEGECLSLQQLPSEEGSETHTA